MRKKHILSFLKISFIYYDTEQMMWLEVSFYTGKELIDEMMKNSRETTDQSRPPPTPSSWMHLSLHCGVPPKQGIRFDSAFISSLTQISRWRFKPVKSHQNWKGEEKKQEKSRNGRAQDQELRPGPGDRAARPPSLTLVEPSERGSGSEATTSNVFSFKTF